jgi:hypothetical protein
MAMVTTYFQTYVLPYIVVLFIAFASIWFAYGLSGRSQRWKARRALATELVTNAKVTKQIVQYADQQLSGDTSVAPMPRYQTQAFLDYKRLALGRKIPPKILGELESLYLSKESVNEAGRRQEELAFGPAAAFPNAHTLRLENLTYLRDTAHNMIEPYLDRLKGTRV